MACKASSCTTEKGMIIKKRVIVTVYVESPTIVRCRERGSTGKIKPNQMFSKPTSLRTQGYNRRAKLLAYAQQLRNANSQQPAIPMNCSKPKSKKWRCPSLQSSISRLFGPKNRPWKYERIVTEDYSNVDGLCCPGRIKRRKKESTKRSRSHFCKRLRCLLKELSCSWKCNKG